MENILDIVNKDGTPFRVVHSPNGGRFHNAATVEFFDRRYQFTEHGQFTGARYYVSTLLEDFTNNRGLDLYGSVPEWSIDPATMVLVMLWLKSL